jgi:hypothetical protein
MDWTLSAGVLVLATTSVKSVTCSADIVIPAQLMASAISAFVMGSRSGAALAGNAITAARVRVDINLYLVMVQSPY